jgi:RNA polymerase sigma-70 factor (ECF subfamily)
VLGETFAEELAAAQSGDEVAFTRIWRATQPALLRFLRVRDPGLADDIAAEAWLAVIGRLGEFTGDENGFRAWVVTIGRHKLVDHHRRAGRRPERLTDSTEVLERSARWSPDTADTAELAEERAATERALRLVAELPPDVAEMVALRVVVGLDVAQVAAIVGRRPGTVRVAVHRGLRRLAQVLEQRGVTTATQVTLGDRDA